MRKRLTTIQDAILPLNEYARVVIVGTVTMPGSIVHQLVRSVTTSDPAEQWITDEKIRVHHYPAIVSRPDGSERSTWPAKWPLSYLQSIRHTRAYRKNMANDPMGADGAYWTADDFQYGMPPAPVTRVLLSVDPAVTTRTKSDATGLAVIGWTSGGLQPACVVLHAEEVRLTSVPLRDRVLLLLSRFPDIRLIVVETNQGGDLWTDVFHDMPVQVKTVHQSAPKEVRAAQALGFYQRRQVWHAVQIPVVEEQMVVFPRGLHDDVLDAACTGILRFLDIPPKKKVGVTTQSYVG